jgi:hypothetical protein
VGEAQVRVVAQLEGDDRADAGRADGVADAHELLLVQARRLLEHEVLARLGRRHRLLGVEVVGRRDGDDVHLGIGEQILVARRDARARCLDPVLLQVGERTVAVAPAQPEDARVRIALEGDDVLRGAPADAADADAKRPIRSRHGSPGESTSAGRRPGGARTPSAGRSTPGGLV